ncbi:MAG: zinc ribbon domain-containing protein [Oscillospiraceae bacterium]|nr:zinc ribbon domain-containing protein [Oscillospiraceae bacterium]
MAFDFDLLMKKGAEVAEAAKRTAVDLADKGKKQVDLVNEQAKLAKAQRQLGALVYSLAKNGEENQPLVDKYIQAIADIEAAIEELKAEGVEVEEPVEEPIVVDVVEEPAAEPADEPKPNTCPQCHAEVQEDALFCNQCGAQL